MDRRPPQTISTVDLLVAAGRLRTVLVSGFLAGVCVFFAPLVMLAIGLLAAYLTYVANDGTSSVLGLARPLTSEDFRSVFAPVVNEAPLLAISGTVGLTLALLRRTLARRADPAFLAAAIRPFFPEFCALYAMLVAITFSLSATRSGWPQVERLMGAAPIYLLFMLCATWLAHAVWHYAFHNLVDLLATERDREAAQTLRGQARLLRTARPLR